MMALAPVASAGTPDDAAAVWQGFDQEWDTRNHRWNRIGSRVSSDYDALSGQLEIERVATAASGLAGDTAVTTTQYEAVAANRVWFQGGSTSFVVAGPEHTPIRAELSLSVPAKAMVIGGGQGGERLRKANIEPATILLNGFDFVAYTQSKKPERFSVWLDDLVYDSVNDEFDFVLGYDIQMGCDSDECRTDPNQVDYDLTVEWLIVAGEGGALEVHDGTADHSHSWDKNTEPMPTLLTDRVDGRAGMPSGVLGLRGLSLDLSQQEQWMLSWHNRVQPATYDVASGDYDFDYHAFFKGWKNGMLIGAKKTEGRAEWEQDVVLLQFADGQSQGSKSEDQTITWPGCNALATSPLAETTLSDTVQF